MKVPEGWLLRCVNCGRNLTSDPKTFTCPDCSEILELKLKQGLSRKELFREGRVGVWRYAASLPVQHGQAVSMNEGGTPLVRSTSLGKGLGLSSLYFKVEGQNPTGSFKDRGMTVAVSRAVGAGAKILICASTGNTAASLAAYSAKAGVKSAVVLPSGKVAPGKLTQAIAHGAQLIQVNGSFDKALEVTT
ncbi:MAG TPA: pyridoxal-phosphate dependent enzyme, partial [Nitrososphaerales archaeon]|nr:pyridoxal-phosphate dependent enzyme [Nitrososphaerales archaeon]